MKLHHIQAPMSVAVIGMQYHNLLGKSVAERHLGFSSKFVVKGSHLFTLLL